MILVFFTSLVHGLSESRNCDQIDGKSFFSQRQHFLTPKDNCVNVMNCIFIACRAHDENGGAIHFLNKAANSSLVIHTTTFRKCSSDKNGGALSVQSMEAIITRSCIYESKADGSGSALYYDSLVNSLSVTNMTIISGAVGNNMIEDLSTATQINYVNSTNSKADTDSSFLKLHSKVTLITYNTIYKQTGQYTIIFSLPTENPIINTMNIVENTASEAIIAFNGNWKFDNTIFQSNTGSLFKKLQPKSDSSLSVEKCIFDISRTDYDSVIFNECKFDTKQATYEIPFLDPKICPVDGQSDVTSTIEPNPSSGEDDSVWKDKGVIGALSGGVVGALIIGMVIGVTVVICTRKSNIGTSINTTPLIDPKEK